MDYRNQKTSSVYHYCICLISLFTLLISLTVIMSINIPNNLSFAAWNMRCCFDTSKSYMRHLADKADIIAVSEHGLFPCELHKLDSLVHGYTSIAKASAQLSDNDFGARRGIGGCAIIWNKNRLNCKVKPYPDVGSDRICMVEIILNDLNIFLISVYMPHQSCQISHFDTELRNIQMILDEFSPKGTCIIIGDINVNFSKLHGIRCSGNTSPNGEKFINVMNMYDMVVADIGYKGNGPMYSYVGWHGTSYLDHVVAPHNFMKCIRDCTILQDCVENVSDHLPIILNTNISIYANPNVSDRRQVSWHKLTQSDIQMVYTEPLEQMCRVIFDNAGFDPDFVCYLPEFCGTHDINVLENIFAKISEAMIQASNLLPHTKFSKALKPYWNENLSELSKHKKQSRSEWAQMGKPRDKDNVYYKKQMEAKRIFRREQRKRVYEYECGEMEELINAGEINQRYFWFLVNKKKHSGTAPIYSDDGQLLTDPNMIRNEWNSYYEELFSDNGNDNCNHEFKEHVETEVCQIYNELANMVNSMYLKGGPATYTEIDKLISKLKNKKAPGWDQLTSEHIKYSGKMIKSAITWLINGLIKASAIPENLKKGVLISIPKANKDACQKGNNRGITLLPVLYKLFEKFMLEREQPWVDDVLNEIQSCSKEHISCLHTSFILQQAIAYNVNHGETVYAAFLDTQKAFDTVWIKGLLYKLHQTNINPKLWLLINNAYSDFKCTAMVDGKTDRWFYASRGVHQGAPLSMVLYTLYINDLLNELKINVNGLCIEGIKVTSPTHADDLAIVTIYKKGLNALLSIAYEYSQKWRYTYNFSKTILMIWGHDRDSATNVFFGDKVINKSTKCKHMGITLVTETGMSKNVTCARVGSGRNMLFASRGLGSTSVPMAPNVLSRLYWSICIPKMTYGLDVTPITDSGIETLENAHRYHANIIQNVPQCTPRPAPLATLGWISIQAYIAYIKIMFLFRVLCLDRDSIYRRVMTACLQNMTSVGTTKEKMKSPAGCMFKFIKLYGLDNMMSNYIINGNWKDVNRIKRYVKSVIWKKESQRWKATCLMYKDLWIYNDNMPNISMHPWWTFVKECPYACRRVASVMSLLQGCQPRGIMRNMQGRCCRICEDASLDGPVHILFECRALHPTSMIKWDEILRAMPTQMARDIELKSSREKTAFIISGLRSNAYITEWRQVYLSVASMIHHIYKARAALYDNLPP